MNSHTKNVLQDLIQYAGFHIGKKKYWNLHLKLITTRVSSVQFIQFKVRRYWSFCITYVMSLSEVLHNRGTRFNGLRSIYFLNLILHGYIQNINTGNFHINIVILISTILPVLVTLNRPWNIFITFFGTWSNL